MTRVYLFFIILFSTLNLSAQSLNTYGVATGRFSHFEFPQLQYTEDGEHFTKTYDGKIVMYNISDGSVDRMVFDGTGFKSEFYNGTVDGFKYNNQNSAMIIKSETEYIYRHSNKAKFFVFDGISFKPIREEKISYATFNPQGNKVAYVCNNNLFYYDIKSGETFKITHDGKKNQTINGSADWVYEEEFAIDKMFEWSPNGYEISFIKFNETDVPEFIMPHYNGEMYPEFRKFKYPKVGENNSKVSLYTFNIIEATFTKAKIDEEYIPRFKYNKVGNLIAFTLNRHQNELKLKAVNTRNGNTRTFLKLKDDAYVDINDQIVMLDNGFVMSNTTTGYNHLYYYDYTGKVKQTITKGKYEVTELYGVDEYNNVYFQTNKGNNRERIVVKKNLKTKKETILTKEQGYNDAQFNSACTYFVLKHSTINTAPTFKLYTNDGTFVRDLELNKTVLEYQEQHSVSKVEFFDFKNEGQKINGYIILPPNYNKRKDYPLFLTGYNGPGHQNVKNKWIGYNYWWYQQLAQNGIIVACVDTRGTGGKGEQYKKQTYMQLGKLETEDLIAAAKFLKKKRNIKDNKVLVQGWSYGGYMSSLAMLKSNGEIPYAIAVAPVTNWKWYDTIYTERYMRTYAENQEGYDKNSPINFVDNMTSDNKYLIIHGTSDDNVHLQHTTEMMNALIKTGKQFDSQIYPANNHGIYGEGARPHLYQRMNNFIFECLLDK